MRRVLGGDSAPIAAKEPVLGGESLTNPAIQRVLGVIAVALRVLRAALGGDRQTIPGHSCKLPAALADDPPDPAPVPADTAPVAADPAPLAHDSAPLAANPATVPADPARVHADPTAIPADPAPVLADLAPIPTEPAPVPADPAPTTPEHVAVVASPRSPLRRFAFLAIPLVALLELGAHLVQTHDVVSDKQWLDARKAVLAIVQPKDLVAMAPSWTDPIGRELLKDDLLSIAREARPDATRFPRAIEVSIRGQHLPELADWKVESTKRVGPVTLTVYDNPSYTPVLDDLVDHVAPGKMLVSTNAGDCPFTHGRVETGPLGFGPALPADRFVCPQGGSIGATIMQPSDYRPHRCLFAPPIGSGETLRVHFLDVAFGDTLHGHAGIDWDSTAHAGPPVTLVWKVGDRTLARVVEGAADGWKQFEIDTRDLKGQKGELVAEVSSPSSHHRLFCFEADTR
jgi:hypothetical protein